MRKVLAVLMVAAFACAICACPLALAGSCTYRSYGGYGHGYDYHGYSTYYGGSYWWPGGYWKGGGGYGPGYYSPGYYDYKYDYKYQPVAPYFPKYESAIIIAKFPSYGLYREEAVPERPTAAAPAPAVAAPAPAAAPCAATAAGGVMDQKIDRILSVVGETAAEVGSQRRRIEVIERHLGITPPAAPARAPAAKPPPPPAPGKAPAKPPADPTPGEAASDVPSLLHARCASCHDAKAVMTERAKVTLFAEGKEGPEMATLDEKGELVPLPLSSLKKVEKVLADGTMPPSRDASGKAVAAMPPAERQKALAWVRKVLAEGGGR